MRVLRTQGDDVPVAFFFSKKKNSKSCYFSLVKNSFAI
jgi:hypothetical protein